MLSILYPSLYQKALRFPSGIHCTRVDGEGIPRIILKLPVNYLLPAKINKGFKIYVIPVDLSGQATLSLICAFFDDADSPLVTWRLLDNAHDTLDLLHALTKPEVFVHLFDDHNAELLGYHARIDLPLKAKIRLEHITFPPFTHDALNAAHEQAMVWFGNRDSEGDAEAIHVQFGESLFPDDVVVIDAKGDSMHDFHGSSGFGVTILERTDPGRHQELDIVHLLQRVFRPDQIYHAPLRHYDKEEIADIIVITDSLCLVIQAKDAPNTEQSMNRTLDRKRLASLKKLKNALGQLSGAVNYIYNTQPLRMLMGEEEITIDLGDRNVLSLAVVRELFIDMYDQYSEELFKFFGEVELPGIALDYAELHSYTSYLDNEDSFVAAYLQVFDAARDLGEFPRLRFGVNDAKNIMQNQEN